MKKFMIALVAGGVLVGTGMGAAQAACDDPGEGGCTEFDTEGTSMTCRTEDEWEGFLSLTCSFIHGLPELCGFQVTVPCVTAEMEAGFRFATYYCCP